MGSTDPAMEAARRTLDRWTKDGWNASRDFVAIESAREALTPIRSWYEAEMASKWEPDWEGLSRLIYTSEELSR